MRLVSLLSLRGLTALAALAPAALAALAPAALVPPASAATLTTEEIVRAARESSPSVLQARARAESLRALAGGAAASPEARTLELAAGPRFDDETTLEAEAAWELPLDAGSRRAHRVGAAEAAAAQAELEVAEAQRLAAASALEDLHRAIHADAIAALSSERVSLASELLETARERERAGDVARFEVNVAAVELARAQSEQAREAAAPAAARARLAATLGVDVAGLGELPGGLDADALRRLVATIDAEAAEAAAASRADVRAAQGELASATADVELARSASKPPPAFRVSAAHEEDADIAMAGVVFSFGSPARTRAEVESGTIRREAARRLVATRLSRARAEIAAARAALDAADASAAILKDTGLRLADENAALAREGYGAGKLDLPSLLIIRRDALQARREHLDVLLDAALAGVALWAALGAPDPGDLP